MPRSKRIWRPTGDVFKVCPWQYTRCKLPAGKTCPERKGVAATNNIADWQKAVSRAERCSVKGGELSQREYNNRRLGELI